MLKIAPEKVGYPLKVDAKYHGQGIKTEPICGM